MEGEEKLQKAFAGFMKKAISDWSKQTGGEISGSQAFILEQLKENGPRTISELASDLEVTLSAITSLSDSLIKSNLILRERSEKDRRIVRLVITKKGSELISKIKKNRNERISMWHQGLTEEELDFLIKIYTKFS